MNSITRTLPRPTLSLPFGEKTRRPSQPAPAGTLSTGELRRIVAAMLG